MKRCDDTRQWERGLTSGQPITAARCYQSISGALRLVTGYCRDESIPSVRPESVDHPVPPALSPTPTDFLRRLWPAVSEELGKTPIWAVSRIVTILGVEIHLFQMWTYWHLRLLWSVFHHFSDGLRNSHTSQTNIILQFVNPNIILGNTRACFACQPPLALRPCLFATMYETYSLCDLIFNNLFCPHIKRYN